MLTVLVRRVLPMIGLLVILASLVRGQRPPVPEGDTYFHLRMGDEFLGGWSITRPGHLSPFDSADWIATQWLSQLAMSWMSDAAGLAGVLWAAGVLMIVLVLAVYCSCRVWAAPLPAALVTGMVYVAAAPGLSARPQLISYLMVMVVTAAWLATGRDGRPRYWLVPLSWLWVPLHGMWIIGIIIGFAAVLGLALERRFGTKELVRLASIPILSGLVVLLTPVGTDAYRSLLVVGTRATYFAEWASPDLLTISGVTMLTMIALVVLVGLRRDPLAWHLICLVAVAAAWGLYSERTVPVAALMIAPLTARAVQSFLPPTITMRPFELATIGALAIVSISALGVVLAERADDAVVPPWLDARLEAMPGETRILNDWDSGAYFLWRHPEKYFVMHGYGDVFTDAEIVRNADIMRLQPEWDQEIRRLRVDVAVLPRETPLEYSLSQVLCWRTLEGDEEFVLMVPPTRDASCTRSNTVG